MNLPDPPTDRPLVDAVIALLAARGPLSYEQISDALGEDPTDGQWEDVLYGSAVDGTDRIVELLDERLADAVSLHRPGPPRHRLPHVHGLGSAPGMAGSGIPRGRRRRPFGVGTRHHRRAGAGDGSFQHSGTLTARPP
jgi:hypothetical protein